MKRLFLAVAATLFAAAFAAPAARADGMCVSRISASQQADAVIRNDCDEPVIGYYCLFSGRESHGKCIPRYMGGERTILRKGDRQMFPTRSLGSLYTLEDGWVACPVTGAGTPREAVVFKNSRLQCRK